MPQFSIPGVQISVNVQRNSPGVTPGANFHAATIILTNPNGDWPATVDNTRHIVVWGLQRSDNGGASWDWGPVHQREPLPGLPFGSRDKSGGMPAMGIASSDLVGLANSQLRLSVLTDADVRLGATIVVT